jgi:hypothetical protein
VLPLDGGMTVCVYLHGGGAAGGRAEVGLAEVLAVQAAPPPNSPPSVVSERDFGAVTIQGGSRAPTPPPRPSRNSLPD